MGDHLQAAYGYRGAFGIDGVLTADGFRPTELNTRISAGLTTEAEGRARAARAGADPPAARPRHRPERRRPRVAGAADGRRAGRQAGRGRRGRQGRQAARAAREVRRSPAHPRRRTTAATCSRSPTPPPGFFAKIEPCVALAPGRPAGAAQRRAVRRCSTEEYAAGLPPVEAAPTCADDSRLIGCSPWRGSWWWVGASAGLAVRRPARQARPRGHPGRALGRPRAARCRSRREDGFAWDAGPSSTLLPAVIRDLFRKSGRPLERELDLEPLADDPRAPVRGRLVGPAARRLAGRPDRARSTGSAAGSAQRWVDHVASYADDWETLRRGYLEVPWDPDAPPARAGRAARTAARCCTSGCKKDVQGRAAAAGRRAPVRRRRPRPAQRARLARRDGVRRAAVRRVDGARRAGRVSATALARPAGDAQGRRS